MPYNDGVPKAKLSPTRLNVGSSRLVWAASALALTCCFPIREPCRRAAGSMLSKTTYCRKMTLNVFATDDKNWKCIFYFRTLTQIMIMVYLNRGGYA